jgi:hypothetical protein
LKDGRVDDIGKLDELLERNLEMQDLWRQDDVVRKTDLHAGL